MKNIKSFHDDGRDKKVVSMTFTLVYVVYESKNSLLKYREANDTPSREKLEHGLNTSFVSKYLALMSDL